jgi:hypothetical protein
MNPGKILAATFLGIAACWLAGCIDKTPIPFTGDVKYSRLTNSAARPQTPSLSKADEVKVEKQVFSDLLTRHFWDDGGYTAIFLQAEDKEFEELQAKFSDHKPPLKPSYRANLRPNMTPLDKDTGKPAMILSVDVNEPEPDGSVMAIGRWYAGPAVTGFYSFLLKKNGSDWEVQNPP